MKNSRKEVELQVNMQCIPLSSNSHRLVHLHGKHTASSSEHGFAVPQNLRAYEQLA